MPIFRLIEIFILIVLFALSMILILTRQKAYFQSKLSGIILMIYALFFASRILWFDFKIILDYPHLLGIFSPILFLPGPILFFLSRNLARNNFKISKIDYLHFIPAIIHLLEMVSFYMRPAVEKLEIAKFIIEDPSSTAFVIHGVVPGITIHMIRLFIFIIYLSYSFFHVISSFFQNKNTIVKKKTQVYFSLIFFLFVNSLLFLQYFNNLQYYYSGETFLVLREGIHVTLFACILFFIFYSYMNLKLNIDFGQPLASDYLGHDSKRFTEIFGELSVEKKLQFFLEEKSLYLKNDITIEELGGFIDMHCQKTLKELIDKVYGLPFKSVIINLRIHYAKSQIENYFFKKEDLNSLALKSGFESGIALTKAFKKEFNCTPFEYHKKIF